MKLYRSLLFVPGNRPEWVDKAANSGADALVLDLEDAVPIADKQAARAKVRESIAKLKARNVPAIVRINGVQTGLAGEDLEAIVSEGLVGVMVCKLETREEVLKVDAWIELFEQKAGLAKNTVEIIGFPESALGIRNAYELATACPRVGTICGGIGSRSGDVTKAIGYQWTPEEQENLYIASHLVLAVRAAGIAYPMGAASLVVNDKELNRRQYVRARQIGFRGAMAIHPTQVPVINEVFSPSREEIEWNKGILIAMAKAEAEGRAAVTYDGMMVDYAHVRNALELIQQAESFGMDVGEYPAIKAL